MRITIITLTNGAVLFHYKDTDKYCYDNIDRFLYGESLPVFTDTDGIDGYIRRMSHLISSIEHTTVQQLKDQHPEYFI